MPIANETHRVSVRYTLALEDGTPIRSGDDDGGRFDYTPGQGQIVPAIEEALSGAIKGDKKLVILSPEQDPTLQLATTRLALSVGHSGRSLIVSLEIL